MIISKTPKSNVAWFDNLGSTASDWHLLWAERYAEGSYVRIVSKIG